MAFTLVFPTLLLLANRCLPRQGNRRYLAVAVAIIASIAVTAFFLRSPVLEEEDGYPVEGRRVERFAPITVAAWKTAGALSALRSDDTTSLPSLVLGVFALVGIWYLGRALLLSIRDFDSEEGRLPGIVILWLAGTTLLVAPQGIWFPRQAYLIVSPLSLMVGLLLANGLHPPFPPRLTRLVPLLPQVLLIGWIALHSPALRGPDTAKVTAWRNFDEVLKDMARHMERMPEVRRVWVAAPSYTAPKPFGIRAREELTPPLFIRLPKVWLEARFRERPLIVDGVLLYEWSTLPPLQKPILRSPGGSPSVFLPPGTGLRTIGNTVHETEEGNSIIVRFEASSGNLPHYLYFHDGEKGRLVSPF
jgi:hypothetical protein